MSPPDARAAFAGRIQEPFDRTALAFRALFERLSGLALVENRKEQRAKLWKASTHAFVPSGHASFVLADQRGPSIRLSQLGHLLAPGGLDECRITHCLLVRLRVRRGFDAACADHLARYRVPSNQCASLHFCAA